MSLNRTKTNSSANLTVSSDENSSVSSRPRLATSHSENNLARNDASNSSEYNETAFQNFPCTVLELSPPVAVSNRFSTSSMLSSNTRITHNQYAESPLLALITRATLANRERLERENRVEEINSLAPALDQPLSTQTSTITGTGVEQTQLSPNHFLNQNQSSSSFFLPSIHQQHLASDNQHQDNAMSPRSYLQSPFHGSSKHK